jgi:hypothetical protein
LRRFFITGNYREAKNSDLAAMQGTQNSEYYPIISQYGSKFSELLISFKVESEKNGFFTSYYF